MDTTGTFEMALALSKHGVVVALVCILVLRVVASSYGLSPQHKHYSTEEIVAFTLSNPEVIPFIAVSAGTSQSDITRISEVALSSFSF